MFSSSSSPLQSSFSWPSLLLWPPLLFLLFELHAQLDVPLLLLPIELEAIASPYAFAAFLITALQAPQCYFERYQSEEEEHSDIEEKQKTSLFWLCIVDLGTITGFFG